MSKLRRSMLFLPGANAAMLSTAFIYRPDSIMFDLEDAVALREKDTARMLVFHALQHPMYQDIETVVRINPLSTPFGLLDLEAAVRAGVDVIRLPKTDTPDDIYELEGHLERIEQACGREVGSTRVMAAIESAIGVINAVAIARSSPRLIGIALAAFDYVMDMQTERGDGTELFYARCAVLHAARAAGIDAFDIEVDTTDPEEFIRTVKAIAPTFGGINLEDIKAPECFEIETRLKNELDIPVMHDDQHGTAIISGAGLINALEIAGKKIEDVKIVVNGAGAASISCTKLYIMLGAKKENIIMCDSKGVISTHRTDLNESKKFFATDRDIKTLAEAVVGADVFLGLSVANVLTQDMVRSMNTNPIVFALANPNPEISYEKAIHSRPDIIFATGRSDYPNQINNVLGFPYIFRGALDVQARSINEEMKLAATYALAELTKEPVPENVKMAYNDPSIAFGRNYIIPKPLDTRLISRIAPAVAKAAIESGVARTEIEDWDAYRDQLEKRMGQDERLMRRMTRKAKTNPKRIVFAEGADIKTLMAVQEILSEKIAHPILIGNKTEIETLQKQYKLELPELTIFDPTKEIDKIDQYTQAYYEKRQRKGIILEQPRSLTCI